MPPLWPVVVADVSITVSVFRPLLLHICPWFYPNWSFPHLYVHCMDRGARFVSPSSLETGPNWSRNTILIVKSFYCVKRPIHRYPGKVFHVSVTWQRLGRESCFPRNSRNCDTVCVFSPLRLILGAFKDLGSKSVLSKSSGSLRWRESESPRLPTPWGLLGARGWRRCGCPHFWRKARRGAGAGPASHAPGS